MLELFLPARRDRATLGSDSSAEASGLQGEGVGVNEDGLFFKLETGVSKKAVNQVSFLRVPSLKLGRLGSKMTL